MGTLDDEPLVIGLCSLGNILGRCAMCAASQAGTAKFLYAEFIMLCPENVNFRSISNYPRPINVSKEHVQRS